jgi:hypothetical protein
MIHVFYLQIALGLVAEVKIHVRHDVRLKGTKHDAQQRQNQTPGQNKLVHFFKTKICCQKTRFGQNLTNDFWDKSNFVPNHFLAVKNLKLKVVTCPDV